MAKDMEGRVALVTGGASGIGAATARLFAERGARVVIADLNRDAGAALADTLGGAFAHTDVTVEADVEAAVALAADRFGRLDVMVNNAGLVGAVGSIMETSSANWSRTLAVLLDGVFYGVKHSARLMAKQKSGVILSVTSVAGLVGGLGPHVYTVAKHGVVGLTRSAASELSALGIRVNAVAPALTVTPMIANLRGSEEQAIADATSASALGSALMPDEIAATLAFLASDAARHITGQVVAVDSGQTTSPTVTAAHSGPVGFVGGG